MRFQDAVPDARAVTYARIQADPLVASMAEALADATPAERLLARRDERRDPRAAGWRAAFPTVFDASRPPHDLARAGRGPRRGAGHRRAWCRRA
ncbi:MAG: hypothetical protein R3C32_12690 [Chloroflexota bacterium]